MLAGAPAHRHHAAFSSPGSEAHPGPAFEFVPFTYPLPLLLVGNVVLSSERLFTSPIRAGQFVSVHYDLQPSAPTVSGERFLLSNLVHTGDVHWAENEVELMALPCSNHAGVAGGPGSTLTRFVHASGGMC